MNQTVRTVLMWIVILVGVLLILQVLRGYNTTSREIGFTCAREWSVGSSHLNQLALLQSGVEAAALVSGVQFFQDDLTNPDADPVLIGFAEPRSALLGVDYQCEALLVFQFRQDPIAFGGFRVDFEVILP